MRTRLLVAAIFLAGCASDVGASQFAQIPVNPDKIAVYGWTLVTDDWSAHGHVVVRGPDADAIGRHGYAADSETWYVAEDGEGDPTESFTLELQLARGANDDELLDAIDEVVSNENEVGSMSMTPQWQSGAQLGDASVFTLTSCSAADGCATTLERVSIQYNDLGDLPTIFAEDDGIDSVFVEDLAELDLEEGDTATFSPVDGGGGYPDETWVWVGAQP